MKIVIVGTAYPMRGGIAQYIALLYKYFSKDNDVKIYSFKRQYPELFFPGKTQYEQDEPAIRIPDDRNVISVDSVNPFNWIRVGRKIAKENADLIIFKYWIPFFAPCFATISYIAKKFSGAKILIICDNVIPHEKRPGDRTFTKMFFSLSDFFVVMSGIVEKDLKLFNKKNKPYKLLKHPVYNLFGDPVSKDEGRKFISDKYGIDVRNEKVILFFGYIRRYKGLSILLEAMPQILKHMDLKLLVVGEFYEDEKKYRDQIRENGLEENVKVVSDFVPDSNVRYFFSASDVVVLPYIDATQSGIIQIAYHFNKPVIATDVGGLAEVVNNNETGFIIKANDPKALSEAITGFYSEGLEKKFAGEVSREKEKYRWEVFIDEVLQLTKK